MANDTLTIADPDTFNVDWLRRDKGDVFTALETLKGDTLKGDTSDVNSSLNAIKNFQPNFGLGQSFIGLDAADDDEFTMPEVSQETIDNITPAIGIGVGEILTRGRGFVFPEGLRPKIKAGGAKGLSYMIASRANKMGKDFSREYLGYGEGASAAVGGATAYTAWKGIPAIVNAITSNVKVGMVSGVMENLLTETGKGAWKETLKEGLKMGASRANTINAASIAGKEAMKAMSDETMLVLKERMGKTASQGFDDVLKQLAKPSVSAKVGRFLVAHGGTYATKVAAKLAISSTAVVVPEPVSTVVGALGFGWAVYDVFNLASQMPALKALIFEDIPEESVEDSFINEATVSDSLFLPDEQRVP